MSLSSKPLSCRGCPLYSLGEGFAYGEGTGANGVLVVAEALGENEAQDSLPLRPYAQAGSVFERAVTKAGYSRESFRIANCVSCRPPANRLEGQSYETAAIEHCYRAHFQRSLDQFRPRAILALGSVAARTLTGMAGRNAGISLVRGFVFNSRAGVPVIPSLHPAFIARGKAKFLNVLIKDIQYAVQIAQTGAPVDRKLYLEHPTGAEAESFLARCRDNPTVPIAYDIETDYSLVEPDESDNDKGSGKNIVSIQFSDRPHHAIVFPWDGEYIEIAKKILGLDNPKWSWNGWTFDDPKLKQHGVRTIGGVSHDLMWAWHHLQPDLPRGLQFATSFFAPEIGAWKHLSSSAPEFYGGADVDSLQRIGARIFTDLDQSGAARGYYRHVVGLQPILKRMCDRGLPVDRTARAKFRESLETERERLDAEIQAAVPESLKGIHPPLGYQNSSPTAVRLIAQGQGVNLNKGRERILPSALKEAVEAEVGLRCKLFDDGYERFYKEKPFLANSGQQLIKYMRAKGHKVPNKLKERNEDGSPKESTEKKGLERLFGATKDEFYLKIIELRELGKMQSTYVDGWDVDENDRVHSTFMFAPATGQLSSRDPNVQNLPKGGALAKAYRKTIAASSGKVLAEFDFVAFHALTLGYEAKDADYMRLARLDIHSYLAGHLLHLDGRDSWLSLPMEQLQATLAEIKREHEGVRNKKAKPTVLGYGFGLGAAKLYDMNIESFQSKKEAQGVIDMLNSLFPKTAKFREEIKEKAYREKQLVSEHGYLRRFADVYHYQQVSPRYHPQPWDRLFTGRNGKTYKRVAGDEAEASIAFLPSNDAFGHIKDVMIRCEELGYNERYGLVNTIHDSILFEVPKVLLDDCLQDISREMERPSEVLVDPEVAPKGLACGISAGVGVDWASLNEVYSTPIERVL